MSQHSQSPQSAAPRLSDSAFHELADETLDALESALERAGDAADVDLDMRRSGNVLTVDFPNGSTIIINSQAPLQEMWVAARAGGFHYRRANAQWVDTRSGRELYAALSDYASQQAGVGLQLT